MSLATELCEYLKTIPTVDAHEHLGPETPASGQALDFSTLMANYVDNDLVAAGAPEETMTRLHDGAQPIEERWAAIEPYFNAIRHTGYGQMVVRTVRGLLGFHDIDAATIGPISEKLRGLSGPGRYDSVLRQRCNLAACIQCWYMGSPGPDYFYHLAPGPELVSACDRAGLDHIGKLSGLRIRSVGDIVEAIGAVVDRWAQDPKVVGVKLAHAYGRPIEIRRRTRAEADAVYRRLSQAPAMALGREQVLPLEDYLMFQLARVLEARQFPLVIHTGLQAGNRARIADAHPLGLQALLEEFPDLKVDIFHGGMPWVREVGVLARHFPGVHLNMAWMHIISPAQARSALAEWLDSVPATKIFGFGGDLAVPECVYGHLEIARQDIAAVLAEKVTEGTMSDEEARLAARRLLFDNPNRFYALGLKT